MFPYDSILLAAVLDRPTSISDVLRTMTAIDAACVDGDGLKWFNWLYQRVTHTVDAQIAAQKPKDPSWLAALDVQFAQQYFGALASYLQRQWTPGCWSAMFSVRNQTRIARVQFAFAGVNAHIEHDLPVAIVATCNATGIVPTHNSVQYADYTALNASLDSLIDEARTTLRVRLLGDPLPKVSHVEDTLAGWGLAAAREKSWNSAEVLWQLQSSAALSSKFMDTLDGLTTVGNKALLVPTP